MIKFLLLLFFISNAQVQYGDLEVEGSITAGGVASNHVFLGTTFVETGAILGDSFFSLLDESVLRFYDDASTNYVAFKAPSALTGDTVFVLPDGDGFPGQALITDGSANLSWGEAGGGGVLNFVENDDAEIDTSGWTTYADAAGAKPVDGTGGSANITWTRSTSSPLRGLASFIFTKDAANRQGEGVCNAFTVDPAARAKVLKIEMDYQVDSGTFVAGSSTTDSDVIVYLYDVTNSVLVEPSTFKLFSSTSGPPERFSSSYQTAVNATNYRLCLHVATTSASAYSLKFDNVKVTESQYVYGTPVTAWQDCAVSGSWSTNTTYSCKSRRVGEQKEYDISIQTSGAPSSGTLVVNLPSGDVIDTAKLAGTIDGNKHLKDSVVTIYDNGTATFGGVGLYSTTSSVVPIVYTASGSYTSAATISPTAPMTFASGDRVQMTFSVPIVGLGASTQMSDGFEARDVSAFVTKTTSQTGINPNSSYVKITYQTVRDDSAGMWDATNSRFNIKTSGKYDVEAQIGIGGTNVIANNYWLALRVNGGPYLYGDILIAATSVGFTRKVTRELNLNAGDYVEVYFNGQANNSTNTLSTFDDGIGGYFSISRRQAPTTTSANARVSASYATTAGQSTSSSAVTTILYEAKLWDTHSAYNASNGRFTAPIAGEYQVSASLLLASSAAWGVGEILQFSIYKNGTQYKDMITPAAQATGTYSWSVNGTASVELNAGDYIDVRLFQNSGSAISLNTSNTANWVEIKRVN